MIIGAWFTKSVLLCVAMGEMAGKTALAKFKQHTSHTPAMSVPIAQAFVFA